MALKRLLINKAVAAAFKAIGNVPEAATYRRTTTTYVPATGATTTTNADTALIRALFTKFENIEVDKVSVLASDLKLILQTSELAITPNIATDHIIRTSEGSKVYNIIKVNKDPSASIYIFQLRSPG